MFPKLDSAALRVIGFLDASFAIITDSLTQVGYIVYISDGFNRAVLLIFKSYKVRRDVRSLLVGELTAFSYMFDPASSLTTELRRLLSTSAFPLLLFTDNNSFVGVISKGTRSSERRLMSDVAKSREGFITNNKSQTFA